MSAAKTDHADFSVLMFAVKLIRNKFKIGNGVYCGYKVC